MSPLWTYSLMGSTMRCSSIRSSIETRSSTIVSIICSFLIPYLTGQSLADTNKSQNHNHKKGSSICNANMVVKGVKDKWTTFLTFTSAVYWILQFNYFMKLIKMKTVSDVQNKYKCEHEHAPKSNPSTWIDLIASSSFFMSVSSSHSYTSNKIDDFPAYENGISTKNPMPSQSGI